MFQDKSIAVVVPAYNEETQIKRVVATMPPLVDRIVVVDDASRDRTAQVVEELAAQDPRVVLIRHPENQGVGGAIASGYKWVRDQDLDVAVVMAGDGQMDPDDLPTLLEPVTKGEVDYAKANRLVWAQASQYIPKARFWGNSVLSLLTKIASGYWHVADSQTGYTAINHQALHTVDWDQMYRRYGQPNDLLVRLNVHNFRVRDVPLKPVYNVGEKSGIKIKKVVLPIAWLLCKLFFWRLKEKYVVRDFHPLIFFYAMGVLLFVLFWLLALRFVILWISQGQVPEITAMALIFCAITGLQSIFFAMWFDMEYNKHLK